jgi:tRNA modification GTPase
MYGVNDTIAAVSSPSASIPTVAKSIIRVSGARALRILNDIFEPEEKIEKRGIAKGRIRIGEELEVEAVVYVFFGPGSYTGEDLVEIHVFAADVIVQHILGRLLSEARLAGPGEFTLRAYLNGKMDISQAEAVAEIVAGSNKFQLAAAQKLLAGKLGETAGEIRQELLDLMSLIEVGIDFSGEDIEFVTGQKAVETLGRIKRRLEQLLEGSIRCEEMIDMPAVGLAGAPNAGKSRLLNALLGRDRSIVSRQRATTRDVLTGLLELASCNCALFDCAGLVQDDSQAGVLDLLAREAAIEALNGAQLVLLCVDVSKSDYAEDIAILNCLRPKEVILVATKCDLLAAEQLNQKAAALNKLFAAPNLSTQVPLPLMGWEICGH